MISSAHGSAPADKHNRQSNLCDFRRVIGLAVGKIINLYKVAKHFDPVIGTASFTYARKPDSIAAEAALDGLYIIRTSVPMAQMDGPGCVRGYKSLTSVERAFRTIKTVDLKVRPIHHRTENRVRTHVLLCMLAYYVEWHMRRALAPMRLPSSVVVLENRESSR